MGKFTNIIVLILMLSFFSSSASSAPSWQTIMFPDTGSWGVVVHNPFHGKALKSVGVQWVRLSLRWRSIEKGKRGQYQWNDADKLLDYYLDNKFKIIAILTVEGLCPLYEKDKGNKDVVIDAIARWAEAASERYKGKGIVWEIGNEPEVFTMGGYWNNPVTYTKMARKVANAIKQSDPQAHIAALSVAWLDRDFIIRSLDAGLLSDGTIDIISFHGYHRHTIMPESGLVGDVSWLRRQTRKYAPKDKKVIVVDSERGYAIVPFLKAKPWHSWRNQLYTEEAQAAYLARHYLEEIWIGLEMSIWYKDMRGEDCFSLWYGTETDSRGLRPMGYVYRNLSRLLPDNPKKMVNNQYVISLVDLPDTISAPDSKLKVRNYLRTYLRKKGSSGKKLVIAMWHPVEAFDGNILESRIRIGDNYYEAWRAVSPADEVEIPVKVRIARLKSDQIQSFSQYDLLAKQPTKVIHPLSFSKDKDGKILSPLLKIGPMPTVLVVDIK